VDFSEYQKRTAETAIYPGQGTLTGVLYTALGLGEAGEIQGKVKKILRDDDGVISEDKQADIAAEIGDLLWYCGQLSTEIGADLGDIASANLEKLASRKQRGVLQGSGDER
jgi:NTP pyrophosphatase (non-canonical NTP hydrolase)